MPDQPYKPLHLQRDIGGAQGDANLQLLEWAQRTRRQRAAERKRQLEAELRRSTVRGVPQ